MILIAIGANLPGLGGRSPLETCRWSVSMMDLLPDLQLRGLSGWYETAPVPISSQPAYINAVARLAVEPSHQIDPAVLLSSLMEIEALGGRRRGGAGHDVPNAARALDLDIIDMDGLVRPGPDPILPHPRAHTRAFVLAPIADVAPAWVHPVLGQTAAQLLAALPPQQIRRL
ncbi:MAG TPA: 2-amino-4-hydroxy-6-hydroxymethyldihydropteridine diphosphokinase [Acetobacteraceae bacterium]